MHKLEAERGMLKLEHWLETGVLMGYSISLALRRLFWDYGTA